MNLKEAEFWLPDSMLEFIEKMKDSYKNLFKKEELEEYADEVWKIIQTTYDRIGGSAGIKTKEDLIEEGNFWKFPKLWKNGYHYKRLIKDVEREKILLVCT